MRVSVITSAYNEEAYLGDLFSDFLNQTYPHEQIEIILVNSMSTDQTRQLMLDFQAQFQEEFYDIQVVNNPKRTQPSGFNVGVRHANGEAILKVDAHAELPSDFIAKSVALMEQGELVGGGQRPTKIKQQTPWNQVLHLVEESMFGSSIAAYRKSQTEGYVDSIFHGIYRREIFDDVGLLDEQLIRTEDNEFHQRLRQAGYHIKYDPTIVSYQYMRPNLVAMLKQKYANGYWIGLTSHVRPSCLKLYHFVPFVFVLAIIFSLLLVPIASWLLLTLASVYFLAMVAVTVLSVRNRRFDWLYLLMPLLLFLVHSAYGIGTIVGLLYGIIWRQNYIKNAEERA